MKKAMFGCLPLVLVVATATGCTGGQNFSRPDPETLVLGVTTLSEARTRIGTPLKEESFTANGEKVKGVRYGYAQKIAEDLATWGFRVRHLTLCFVDERLVGFEGRSSFQEDSTDFDVEKLSELKVGTTTRAQVVELLGTPSGKARHPVLAGKDEEALIYSYLYLTQPDRKTVNKRVVVVFGPDDIVRRVDSRAGGSALDGH